MLLSLTVASTLLAGVPSESVRTSAYIDADAIEVGGSYEIRIEVVFPEEVVASEAGAPAPFLQIDVPPSVELTGRELTTYKELARNEFLMEPYERLLQEATTAIPFDLVAEPGPGESIGLNIVAYVSSGAGGAPYFLRRRLELPVRAGLDAVEAEQPNSNWGIDRDLLQIGDTVQPLSLPQADGTEVDLGKWLGKQNLIVTTYRAHW